MDELDDFIKEGLFATETGNGTPQKLYEVRAAAIDRAIDKNVVLAAAEEQGQTADEFLTESVKEMGQISPEELRAFYDENQSQLGEMTYEQAEPRIRSHLRTQRAIDLVARLRAEADVVVHLVQPRLEVAATGPSQGRADAPVTIIEFSDFQCPYCKRAVPIIHEIRERYPEQVRIVFRHLPLERIHPRARPAAEAASCAHKQDKFWAYHDVLFENNKELEDADLEKYAADADLDVDAFRACYQSGEFRATVEADAAAAKEVGVGSTPAFIINGIQVRGAKPIEQFIEIIDGELAALSDAETPAG